LGEALGIEDPVVRDALDPEAFINSRVTLGSPRPDDVQSHIAEAEAQQADHGGWVAEKQRLLAEANKALTEAVDAIVRAPAGS
jgi:hypothetical protein